MNNKFLFQKSISVHDHFYNHFFKNVRYVYKHIFGFIQLNDIVHNFALLIDFDLNQSKFLMYCQLNGLFEIFGGLLGLA